MKGRVESPDRASVAADVAPADETGKPAPARAQASPEDLALLSRLLAGDEAAFAALVEQHHGALLRLARVFVADRAVAEEVVQETWLGVLNGLRSFEGRSTLKTWIFSILTNKAKTRGWRERRSVPFAALTNPDSTDDEPAVDSGRFSSAGMWVAPPDRWGEDTPENLLLRQEARAQIEKAIAELPSNQRAVVTLRDVEGLDSAEVCNMLKISETNQRVLLHRARSKLRGAFERYLAVK
jgi:RNA polymerase sigma-70 factor (ECF subfamily)